MTLTLELSEELASRVRTQADAQGLPVDTYATLALEAAVSDTGDDPGGRQLDGDYTVAAGRFRRLAADLEAGLPRDRTPLSDFAVSRAGIYEDEGSRI